MTMGEPFLPAAGKARIKGEESQKPYNMGVYRGLWGSNEILPDLHSLYFHLNPADTVPLFIALQIALDDTPHSCDAIFKLGYVLIYVPSREYCSTVLLCFSDIF